MKNIKVFASLTALILSSTTLVSCKMEFDEEVNLKYSTVDSTSTKTYKKGQHIISVPISSKKDILSGNFQYDCYPGYEPIGISLTAYGKINNEFGGGAIVYQNTEDVICNTSVVNSNGEYTYIEFGEPINGATTYSNSNEAVKEFDVGMHIISVPFNNDNRKLNCEYEYHDGYEVVGIATTAYGHISDNFGGGVLLYKNIIPVECEIEANGYSEFGKPLEKEKTKSLN